MGAQNVSDNTGAMIPPIVINSDNPNVVTYYQLGNRSMDKALFVRAKRYYEKALKLEKNKDNKAFLKYKINKVDELIHALADEDFDFASRIDGGHYYYLYLEALGDGYMRNAEYQKAKAVYAKLLQLEPYNNLYKTRVLAAEEGINIAEDKDDNIVVKKISRNKNAVSERIETFVGDDLIYSTTKFSKTKYVDPGTDELYYHLYKAKLIDDSIVYDKKALLSNKIFNNEINDFALSFDKTNNIAYFERKDPYDPSISSIYTSTYTNGTWSAPQFFPINGVGIEMSVGQPSISPDGNHLLFTTKVNNNKEQGNIWVCTKRSSFVGQPVPEAPNTRVIYKSTTTQSLTEVSHINVDDRTIVNSDWTIPQLVDINTAGDEIYPVWINNDCFAFSSDGYSGYGGVDLYLAIRDKKTNKFSIVRQLKSPINDNEDAYHLVLKDNSDEIYFSKRTVDKKDKKGGFINEIYSFNKTASDFSLKINVYDYWTLKPIEDVKIIITSDASDNEVYTGEDGKASFASENIQNSYHIEILRDQYYAENWDISINSALKYIPVYNEYEYDVYLVNDYPALLADYDAVRNANTTLQKQREALEAERAALQAEREKLKSNVSGLSSDLAAKEKELAEKEKALADKEAEMARQRAELDSLMNVLQQKEAAIADQTKKINDLEGVIKAQKDKMQTMKDKVREALRGFEGKGITVTEKDGKLYVSMDASLLFASGQWTVLPDGQKALKDVANALKSQEDVSILVEGHTDSDKMNGAVVKDNLDLSVMRASAATKILISGGLTANRVLTAGRGDTQPLVPNDSPANKAKNRRVEVIIEPNVSALLDLLND
jgi:chemotaxis protein MotB